MTSRYNDLRVEEDEQKAQQDVKADLTDNITSLERTCQEGARKSGKRKEHLMGTNHLFKWTTAAENIGTHPNGPWWASFDEKEFRDILADLTEFTDYVHELTHDINARDLERSTERTTWNWH